MIIGWPNSDQKGIANMDIRRAVLSLAALTILLAIRSEGAVEAINAETPWRIFVVCKRQEPHRRQPPAYTASPPGDWREADFDDSAWGRYGSDLIETIGGYGYEQSADTALICLRTRFGVTDPARVRDLQLALEYRGGVAVYVNGQEIARQHLPEGSLEAETPADEYPPAALLDSAGQALYRMDRPADENLERYEQRIRKLTVTVPSAALRKGANVLALEIRAAPSDRIPRGKNTEWSTAGLCGVSLSSASGEGIVPYAQAAKGVTFWNASPLETVAASPRERQWGFLWWGITVTPVGLTRGNPFDPLRPIRMVGPRGGTCSGQVVVSAAGGLSGLKATISPLKHSRSSAVLPPELVRVCYAMQEENGYFCDALMPQPIDGAAVQPVWVLVDIPRQQAPGWYVGTLMVSAAGQTANVPVQVLVAGWTVPDPKDNATLVSMYQSPDTLALHYGVEPWSDRHFALIERSLNLMAKLGNDVLLVPVILDNYLGHQTGLVRWVRKGSGYEPEFSALERYLDLHIAAFGTPKIVTLSVWKHGFGCRSWFRGMHSDMVEPCMVTEFDPATGKMAPMEAPHFGRPGSEQFWKPMIEGVRRIIKQRGVDDRFLLLGEAFDSRPLEPTVEFFQRIAPGMRWQVYAHWVKEPPPSDDRLIALGGLEVGFRINPNGGGLPEFDRNYPNIPARQFFVAQAHRVAIHHTSSPLSYRAVMRSSGTLARIGLDFWPVYVDDRGRRRSYYGSPPNEGWLWRGHSPAITAPGPEGAVPTVRGQMLLECLQETELLISLLRAKQTAPEDIVRRIEQCLAARAKAELVAKALSQATLSLDWPGMAAREYALAGELAGTPSEGDWDAPPPAAASGDGK